MSSHKQKMFRQNGSFTLSQEVELAIRSIPDRIEENRDQEAKDLSVATIASNQGESKVVTMPEDQTETKRSHWIRMLKGISLTILSAACFSITTVVVKYLQEVDATLMALTRYIGIFILSFPLAFESGQPMFGYPRNRVMLVLRGIVGGTSIFCRFNALHYISMADSTVIILAMPVFVFVFARIFLKERFGRFHAAALVISMVGILLASNVEEIIEELRGQSPNVTLPANATIAVNISSKKRITGTLFSVASTLIGSLVYIVIRKLPGLTKSVILFNFSVVATIEMLLIQVIFNRTSFKLPVGNYSPYMIMLVGIFSFYAQLLLTRANQLEEAGIVSVVRNSSEAFFAFVMQTAFFHEAPSVLSIFGAILVISAVAILSFHKYVVNLPDSHPNKIKFKFFAH